MAKKKTTTPAAAPTESKAPPKPNNPYDFLERVENGFYNVERDRPKQPRKPTEIPYPSFPGKVPASVISAIDTANRQQTVEYEAAVVQYEKDFAAWQKVCDDKARIERVDSDEWLRIFHGVVSNECPLYQAIYKHTQDYRNEHCPEEAFWTTLDNFLRLLYSREIRILVKREL